MNSSIVSACSENVEEELDYISVQHQGADHVVIDAELLTDHLSIKDDVDAGQNDHEVDNDLVEQLVWEDDQEDDEREQGEGTCSGQSPNAVQLHWTKAGENCQAQGHGSRHASSLQHDFCFIELGDACHNVGPTACEEEKQDVVPWYYSGVFQAAHQ